MRILAIVDEKSEDYPTYTSALEKLKSDYEGVLDVSWKFEYVDLSNLKWEPYGALPGDLGVSQSWLNKDSGRVFNRDGYAHDTIVYFIDHENWKQGDTIIFGWNLGRFFNNYQIQLVRTEPQRLHNVPREQDQGFRNVLLTLRMEVHHSLNNFIYREMGIHAKNILNVDNFDEDVTHGKLNPPYVRFEYRNSIEALKTFLVETFRRRLMKYKKQLLVKILALLRQILMRLRIKPAPVTEALLDGKDDHHA